MISLALLDASMRYREGYFREDIEKFAEHVNERIDEVKYKHDRGWLRRSEAKAKGMVVDFKNKQEGFNRIVYQKIDEIVEVMPKGFQDRFDNYCTGFGMLAEEFLKAKNTSQMLTICKLYNEGMFENIFKDIEEKRASGSVVEAKDSLPPQTESNGEQEEHY